ncbi:hypothetical protein [Actinotalea sp. K2]|uniref:hypothetical protein n=1 Tax=Actinotalea sp. K2 TaxID=2939438 RepID=UPI0020177C5C|nr:hypothetical protein [Actinotalea sp. K2]MCL3861326.1 hypothetical protein [Actinotalea sp. K2]
MPPGMPGSADQHGTDGWWAPDPMRRAPLRFWSGAGWTRWVSDGRSVWADATPVRRALVASDHDALQLVEEVLLPEAQARGILTVGQQPALLALVAELRAEAAGGTGTGPQPGAVAVATATARPVAARPATARATTPVAARPATAATPPVAARRPAPVRAPAPRQPSPLARWWSRTRHVVGTDLTVHGLAYLGVLLLFVGLFGLVAFAFADVAPAMRPVAELAAASVPFLAARLLLGHGAAVVGRALEVVGGLLLPVMVITSVLDGYPFPPDLQGSSLVVAVTTVCLVGALAYAWWSERHPASGLRYLVAPLLWFAAAGATLGVGRPVPVGEQVAVLSSAQVTALSGALVLTLAAARLRPAARLAGPTVSAGVPGTLVVALLALLTWAAQGWPPVEIGLTGVFLLAALPLLRPRVPDEVLDLVVPAWWAVVTLALVPGLPGAVVATVSAAGFLVLLEVAGRRHRPPSAVALPAVGLGIALVAAWPEAPWAAGLLAGVAGWAAVRRTRPYARETTTALDAAAAVLPVAAVVALGRATDLMTSVVAATALVMLATLLATRPVLDRGTGDAFWRTWWRVASPVVGTAALLLGAPRVLDGTLGAASPTEQWVAVGCLLALAATTAVGPLPATVRVWAVPVPLVAAWLLACSTAEVPDLVRGTVLGVAALAMVVGAHLPRRVAADGPGSVSSHLGGAGHLVAGVSLVVAGGGWSTVAVVGLATAGVLVTAVRDDSDRSPVGAALARSGELARHLPWVLGAIGFPVVVSLALDESGLVPLSGPWATAAVSATALLYAGLARIHRPVRRGTTLAWVAVVAAVLGATTPGAAWPAVSGLAALVLTVVLLPAHRRPEPVRWVGWLASTPLLGLLAWQTVPWFAGLGATTATAATLVVVGAAQVVGAAAADLRGQSWVPHAIPRRRALIAPATLGGASLGAGLLMSAVLVPARPAGTLLVVGAGVMVAVGLLARAGLLGGLGVVTAWWGALWLSGPQIEDRPWIAVLVTAGVLACAEALHRASPDRLWWSRWDVPVLAAAVPVALTALLVAFGTPAFVPTSTVVGALTVVVAVRLRTRRALAEVLGWTGTVLILAGAAQAGSGWLALALLGLAAVHTTLAVRATGDEHILRQLVGVGAALASWTVALGWFAWSAQTSIDVSAAGAGGLALLIGGLAHVRQVERSWPMVWGGAALAVTGVATSASLRVADLSPVEVAPSPWVVLGVLLVAAALVTAASPLRLPVLRDVAAGAVLVALLLAFVVGEVTASARVGVLAGLAALLAAVTLALAVRAPGSPWARPSTGLSGAAAVIAALMGAAHLPDTALLVPVLATAAVQVAALGVAWRSVGLQMASPALACAAWLLAVPAALADGPHWYTVAVGLALLTVVALWRRDRRARGADTSSGEIVALELVGVAFVVGASFVQAVTESLLHALVATALGLAVIGWGVLTRVRRRVATGALVVLAGTVVLVAVPLVALLPAWGDAGLWLLVAGVGLVSVLAATLVERGRAAARSTRGRFRDATRGWE